MFSENFVHSCLECMVRWENFEKLSEEEISLVNESRYEAAFKPGEIIIKQGSPASSAVFLATGMAKVYMEGLDGRNFILGIVTPSNFLASPGAHIASSHTYSVSALTFVQACFVSFEIINRLIITNPSFAMGMMEDLSRKSFTVHNKLVGLTQKKMPGRIAEALLYFSHSVFKADEFDMLLSRQELGEMTNMAKESVVRILKELEQLGLVETNCAKIRILDKDKLRTISERG